MTVEEFWCRVEMLDDKECWEWKGYIGTGGYGRVKLNGKLKMAHRVAYELVFGPLENLCCHECDNRSCCSPYHIYDGTQKDNMNDCWDRERHENLVVPDNIGQNNSRAVLTDKQVIDMRKKFNKGWRRDKLALHFGISINIVYKVISRRSWSHL